MDTGLFLFPFLRANYRCGVQRVCISKLFIGKLFHRLIQPRRRPAGHDADGGSVLILLGAVTILIKLL